MTSRSVGTVQIAPALAARWWALVDAERQSLALWLPVAFAAGIAAWFLLPWSDQRLAIAVALVGLGAAGVVLRWQPLAAMALLAVAGMGVAEWRSARVAHPVLAQRTVASFSAIVTAVESRVDRNQVRMLIAPEATSRLPPLVRISIRGTGPAGLAPGARVRLRAMLSPPAAAAIPGGYDFARRAWFAGIGATGFALGPVLVDRPSAAPTGLLAGIAAARAALTRHITSVVPGAPGAIAAAFVTGDQGNVPLDVATAMRDSGLAHLLSISGLHIAVVVGGTIFLVRRSLTLSPWIALRWPVKTIAVIIAALVGVAYTLLAGAEVPTVRTILATLIVLLGMVVGREAFSLRLLASAAILILAFRPEALLGPSFQLSFAAVIAIVALYESRLGRWLTTPGEDEHWPRRFARHGLALLATGVVAELALSSIGLFHFNRAGVYGVVANLVAIPWSSFVIMPLLMIALAADVIGLGALAWPLVGWAMARLIALATATAAMPGAVVVMPTMPAAAYALIIAGGLWLALWRTRMRWAGAGVASLGILMALAATPPDLIISSDGRHAALRLPDGRLAFLRTRTSDFLISMWSDAVAADDTATFVDLPGMACSRDSCVARFSAPGGRNWQLLATISRDHIDRPTFEAACAAADIVISDRRMPRWCRPRWRVFDRASLVETGAVTVHLATGEITTTHDRIGDHPWRPRPPPQWRKAPRKSGR